MSEEAPTREIKNDGIEFERRWLLEYCPTIFGWKSCHIIQGYVFADSASYLRLRKKALHPFHPEMAGEYFLAVKGFGDSEIPEWEPPMPRWAFDKLWPKVEDRIIEKIRNFREANGLKYFVDIPQGQHKGILILEIEFPDAQAKNDYVLEERFGQAVEITGRRDFSNLALALHGLPADRPFQN